MNNNSLVNMYKVVESGSKMYERIKSQDQEEHHTFRKKLVILMKSLLKMIGQEMMLSWEVRAASTKAWVKQISPQSKPVGHGEEFH